MSLLSISIGIGAFLLGAVALAVLYNSGVLDILINIFNNFLHIVLDLFNKAPRVVQIILFTLVIVFLANFITSFFLSFFYSCNAQNTLYAYDDPASGIAGSLLYSINTSYVDTASFVSTFPQHQVKQAKGFEQVIGVGCKQSDPRLLVIGIDIFNPIIWMLLLLLSLVVWIKMKL